MKKILHILTFLFSIGIYACDCNVLSITEKYIQSDFVANVTIIKNFPNQKGERGYRADIKINETFKGEILKSIYVYGRSDNGIGTSCDIFIPENTKLIAYARKNSDGNLEIGMCSGLLYLNNSDLKFQKRELGILKVFKSKKINFTDQVIYKENSNLYEQLKQFNGIELDKSFGLFRLTFSNNLKVKKVELISGFENDLDKKIIDILKTTEWMSFDNGVRDKVKDNSVLIFGVYYYEADKVNQSFLSHYYI